MFHEVNDDFVRGLNTGITVSCLNSIIAQLRNEGWDIVALDDVMCRLRDGDPSRRFAVLTFDDGYRDLLTRALPILEHHDAPFTVFVPTGAPTRELHSWWLGVRALFERRDEVAIAGMGTVFTCGDIESKMKGCQEVSKWIHQDYRRAPLLTETFREYKISLTSLNDTQFMNEAELRVVARHRLATVGAHTTSHGALSTFDVGLARLEMSDNRAYLEHLIDPGNPPCLPLRNAWCLWPAGIPSGRRSWIPHRSHGSVWAGVQRSSPPSARDTSGVRGLSERRMRVPSRHQRSPKRSARSIRRTDSMTRRVMGSPALWTNRSTF